MPSRAKNKKDHDLLDDIFDEADGTQAITAEDTQKQITEELAEELEKIKEEIKNSNSFESIDDLVALVISKLNLNEIPLNINKINAGLEISQGNGSEPILKFNDSPLMNTPVDGAFEYNNGKLYFTSNGLRSIINREETNSEKADLSNYVISNDLKHYVKRGELNTYATLGSFNVIQNQIKSLETGMKDFSLKLAEERVSDSAKKLLNGETGAALSLSGDHNINFNAATETSLTLPSTGTLATKEDLESYAKTEALTGFASQAALNTLKKEMSNGSATIKDKALTNAKLADNTITSNKIMDKTLTNKDFADNAGIQGSKLKDKSIHGNKIMDGSYTWK